METQLPSRAASLQLAAELSRRPASEEPRMFHALICPQRTEPAVDWSRVLGRGTRLNTSGGAHAAPCCICMEDLAEGQFALALRCGHVYHSDCIHQWLSRRAHCPVCRESPVREGQGG